MTELETKWTLETWDLGQHKHHVVSPRWSPKLCSWGRTTCCSSRGWGPISWVAALLWRTEESTMDARMCVNTVLDTNHKLGTPWQASGNTVLGSGSLTSEGLLGNGKRANKELPRQSKVFVFAVAPFWAPLDYYWQMALETTYFFPQPSTLPDSRAMPQKHTFSHLSLCT